MTHDTDAMCMMPRCHRRPVSAAFLHKAVPTFAATGMCAHHTLAAVVRSKRRNGEVVTETQPAADYRQWVARVHITGTLQVDGLVVRNLTRADIAEMVGVSRNALAALASGKTEVVTYKTAHKLLPWIIYTNPSPQETNRLRLHTQYPVSELRIAPLGTVVVDSTGLAWQRQGYSHAPVWVPATMQKTISPNTLKGTAHVVYLPARRITRSRNYGK